MPAETVSTRDAVLDAAITLVSTVGFNALSYRDIAAQVGITTASIHYHFPAKTDLGLALVARLRSRGDEAWLHLEQAHPLIPQRLEILAGIIAGLTCETGRACPINMLQAEFANLAEPLQAAVNAWVRSKIDQLAGWLDTGRRAGQLSFRGTPHDQARVVWSVLEYGAQLARTNPDMPFKPLADQVLRSMST